MNFLFLCDVFRAEGGARTLRLQPVDDGRRGGEDRGGDAPDAQLGSLAHGPDVRVGVLGAGVHGGHQAVGGADQGQAAHPLHRALRTQNGRRTVTSCFRSTAARGAGERTHLIRNHCRRHVRRKKSL